MRSHHFATRYPNPVFEGMILRQHELKYRTMGEFQTNLNRCDLMIRRDHDCTRWISDQTQDDQDFIDDCLKDFLRLEPGSRISLTYHFCAGMIAKMRERHGCGVADAIRSLPNGLQRLCVEYGFA